jgi:hypothetical protein
VVDLHHLLLAGFAGAPEFLTPYEFKENPDNPNKPLRQRGFLCQGSSVESEHNPDTEAL